MSLLAEVPHVTQDKNILKDIFILKIILLWVIFLLVMNVLLINLVN